MPIRNRGECSGSVILSTATDPGSDGTPQWRGDGGTEPGYMLVVRHPERGEGPVYRTRIPRCARNDSTEAKADAHAAKMSRAKRLVQAGRTSEVEPGVAAASCDIEAVFHTAINYLGDHLHVCLAKANLTSVCDDLTGRCGLNFNDKISSITPDTAYGWCTHVYPAANYKQTASLPYLRGTCRNVPDLRDRADYSTGWIIAENWNDVISSVRNY